MKLRLRILVLALIPLLLTLGVLALVMFRQQQDLAHRQHELMAQAMLEARQAELKNYVDLALSTLQPLHERLADGAPAAKAASDPTAPVPSARRAGPQAVSRAEALRLLGQLDYGPDGYFFVYDLQGRVLMHSRQPELIGRSLIDLKDSQGRFPIRDLLAKAQSGGGFVSYEWNKPSLAQPMPKLGYVTLVPEWQWMIGTGLYLDDVQQALAQFDRQAQQQIAETLYWTAGVGLAALVLVSLAGLALNLTEHRAAETKLRLLARQVVQSQEEERAHLARELHDGVCQTLVSSKLMLETALDGAEAAEPGSPQPSPKARAGAMALAGLGSALQEIRALSHRLRPALLDNLGLSAALQHLADEVAEATGVPVLAQVQDDQRPMPEWVATALYRVAQEALANAVKHAAASEIRLTLQSGPDVVQLWVEDDGQGFDARAVQASPEQGIGLRNMRERLQHIGGQWQLSSAPGQGTQVCAQWPWSAAGRA